MTTANLPVQSTPLTPLIKTRKPYTKRTSKVSPQPPETTFFKKIIKEELLGWNDKFTTAYFQEKIETIDGEIKDFYVTVPDEGVRIYTDEQPKIDNPLEIKKPAKAVSRTPKKAIA